QNQPRRDDFGLKIGKLSHRTSIKDGLGRHIGSCGPLNRNFPKTYQELNPMKTSDPRERHGFSWDFFWGWVGGAFTTTLIYFFCFGDKKNGTKK
ncbi:hypothetical protein, partial [Klebsiella pneumoniae]|uniref:hypothetical protein n=1 Tax=Klebsiella pneumoniae TaxID=573 RepID=UPI0022B6424F